MSHALCLTLALGLTVAFAPTAHAEPEHQPPGLRSARLLPGWTDASGARVMALEILLEPGWKTYWRSPGDTGLPPHLTWDGSDNLGEVMVHWPAPQAIRSGDVLEMGYQDRLILPLTAQATDPGRPIDIHAQIDLGLCDNICVPVHLQLHAPPAGTSPDPAIAHALTTTPLRLDTRPACAVTPIDDGLRVAMALPQADTTLAAIELTDSPHVWVSAARIMDDPAGPQAVVEMVGPSGAPFDLDRAALRLTVIPADGSRATETAGCAPD